MIQYPNATVKLRYGERNPPNALDDIDKVYVTLECRSIEDEAELWKREKIPTLTRTGSYAPDSIRYDGKGFREGE